MLNFIMPSHRRSSANRRALTFKPWTSSYVGFLHRSSNRRIYSCPALRRCDLHAMMTPLHASLYAYYLDICTYYELNVSPLNLHGLGKALLKIRAKTNENFMFPDNFTSATRRVQDASKSFSCFPSLPSSQSASHSNASLSSSDESLTRPLKLSPQRA